MRTVALVVWLTLFAVPQTLKADARPLPVCLNNLKVIDAVAQQFALEHKLAATNSYALENPEFVASFYDGLLPRCPSGGRYFPATNLVGRPRCSVHGDPDHPINAEREMAAELGRAAAWRTASFALVAFGCLWLGCRWPAVVGFGVSALFASLIALTQSDVTVPLYSGGMVRAGLIASLVEVTVYAAAALLVCSSQSKPVRLVGVALSVISVGIWLLILTACIQSL